MQTSFSKGEKTRKQCEKYFKDFSPRYGYLKKLIEEANTAEDTRRLLQFCCWENPQFSHAVLYELLWQIAFAYTYELRPYLDLLLHMLCMEDSWQNHR